MQNRKMWIALAAVVALAGGWYAFRPERLFVNQTVAETLEGTEAPATPPMSAAATPAMTSAEMTMPDAPAMAEKQPAGKNQVLRTGTFHDGSHHTSGMATVYRLADGRRVLRFTNFETSNGPDVQVYLVAASDAKDNETVTKSGFVRVASLKGNLGDQNYELPQDVDLDKYRAVTIWCRRFGVNFGTAPLATPQS